MEKEMRTIGVIVDDESPKESKDTSKRSQTSMRKVKEKEASDIKNLTCLIKSLTTELVELNQRKNMTTMSNRPSRYLPKNNVASSSSSSQPTKSSQSSNLVLNLDKFMTDSYCVFHHKHD